MEFDLAQLREVASAEEFVKKLNHVCDITLTNDFWNLTLPNDLATSSPRSPSLFAYYAALVLLDARALFSHSKVTDMLDPAIKAHKSAVERHHLFPKAYLKKLGITSVRDTNQIANYALVEWGDNIDISDKSPAEYAPEMAERFKQERLDRMYRMHALPPDWEYMDYRDFLEKRRELMAQVIAEGYATLLSGEAEEELAVDGLDLSKVVMNGESDDVEFKSSLRINLHTGSKDPRIEHAALKTLAAFLNTNGGTLLIGVSDDGSPVGIQADVFENEDKMSQHLVNIVKSRMGVSAMTNIHARFDDHEDNRIMVIKCAKAPTPVFVKESDRERFFIRTGPATTELTPSQTQEYIKQRFQ